MLEKLVLEILLLDDVMEGGWTRIKSRSSSTSSSSSQATAAECSGTVLQLFDSKLFKLWSVISCKNQPECIYKVLKSWNMIQNSFSQESEDHQTSQEKQMNNCCCCSRKSWSTILIFILSGVRKINSWIVHSWAPSQRSYFRTETTNNIDISPACLRYIY